MALTVASDLTVSVASDQNVNKLTDKQEALKKSIKKGDLKSIGISQVMLGFLIISYSVPLLSAKITEVVTFGVPWWSGISFLIAGAIALVMDKHDSIYSVLACMAFTALAAVISVIAIILYSVDIIRNPQSTCKINPSSTCDYLFYSTRFSLEVKSILLFLSMVQAVISSAFAFILYKEKNSSYNY
ncbi:membrane-spanning 4-domains subfamily A member 15 isoform X1, partial [Silurus asotus]